jgi:CCR4-NOT transcription complex subunit 6
LKQYSATAEDVGHSLKFEVVPVDARTAAEAGGGAGFTTGRVIPAPTPPKRNLVPVAHHDGSEGGRFSVLTYNVLADLYATSELYHYTPSWALSWNYRRQNILKEIVGHNADILCLQEVQSDHFEDFFAGELAKHGYTAVYKKKTAQVFSQGTYVIDGCAIFFKKDRFTLIKKYEVEFNKAALSLVESLGGASAKKDALNRLMKDNVALIVVLEALEQPGVAAPQGKRQLLCVANTHIHANTELNDVKLWQVHTLLKGLEKIAASAEIPMVVCGDFNSVPGSAAHNLLSSGRVDAAHPELATDPFGILRPPSKLQHPLPLVSAYTSLTKQPCLESEAAERQRTRMDAAGTGEPLFTNCTAEFMGALDYIFYTDDTLAPLSLLELPAESEVRAKYGGLPNTQWSSDHVALMAEFQWAPRQW